MSLFEKNSSKARNFRQSVIFGLNLSICIVLRIFLSHFWVVLFANCSHSISILFENEVSGLLGFELIGLRLFHFGWSF
jgi:hypothetical protein